jgi:very-short-patch-repair endonuclease
VDPGGVFVKRFDKPLHAAGALKRARRLRTIMTLPEKRLWEALRKTDLHVRRQAPLGRYIADFVSHEARLVIELDGYWHSLPAGQIHDATRDAWMESQGYRVLRFPNQQAMNDLQGVVEAILNTLLPRWGKGRDGGACTAISGEILEATQPPLAFLNPLASTPSQPSPIEGEGVPNSDPANTDPTAIGLDS